MNKDGKDLTRLQAQKNARGYEFEQFILELTARKFHWSVQANNQFSADDAADVYAVDQQGATHLINIKYTSPQTERRIRDTVQQLITARDSIIGTNLNQSTTMILAIAGAMSSRYASFIESRGIVLWDATLLLSWSQPYPDLRERAQELLNVEQDPEKSRPTRLPDISSITCGRDTWSRYQKAVSDILEYLFCPPLRPPIYENSTESGVKRRDILFPNYADEGFWKYLAERYVADYVVVDAKNYCGKVSKTQILQVSNYLSRGGTGLFSLIVTRKGIDTAGKFICREEWLLHQKLIVVLNDLDVAQMTATKSAGGQAEDLIRQKIEDFRLGI